MKSEKKGIQKYHLWLLFFFAIFGFTFAMIIWTVKSAVDTPVYEDRSFLDSYQHVDDNFNDMMIKNHKFNLRYDTKVTVNERTIGLEIKDAFLGYRSLEKQSTNQNILLIGENTISVVINDKQTNKAVDDANITFQVTRSIEDMYDINLNSFTYSEGSYNSTAKIDLAGNWNILAKIQVAEDTGYLYIKTNTKK
ncbi:MAG: FixH family protein [Epsilonproteobacteria bacterium]|nr:FixH family protein [Campylobacterota bacterium]